MKQEEREGETIFKQRSFYTPSEIINISMENSILTELTPSLVGCLCKSFYGHFVKDRITEDYVLIYCVSGQGWLTLNNKTWIFILAISLYVHRILPIAMGLMIKKSMDQILDSFSWRYSSSICEYLNFTLSSQLKI